MLGDHFDDLEVLNGYALITCLAGHTHAFEYLCRVRAGAYRTGGTKTVVLAVSALAYATETVTFHYALIAFTFAGAYNVYEVGFSEEVGGDGVAESVSVTKSFELGQVSLGCYTGLTEVTELGLGEVFLLLVFETKLESLVAVGLYSLNLSNNTRTYFDNSARYIATVGTENGCHSDFLSN